MLSTKVKIVLKKEKVLLGGNGLLIKGYNITENYFPAVSVTIIVIYTR